MIDLADIPHVLAPFSSLASFLHIAKLISRAAYDRL
jgi:hypothetical protein